MTANSRISGPATSPAMPRPVWMPMWTSRRGVGAEARAVRAHLAAHLDRGVHGSARRVLDRLREAEERHHAVADQLLDGAAVLARDLVEDLQAAGDDRIGALGAGALGERREAGDVREENGRAAALGVARAPLPLSARSRSARSAGSKNTPRTSRPG